MMSTDESTYATTRTPALTPRARSAWPAAMLAVALAVGCDASVEDSELGERDQVTDTEVDEIIANLVAADYPEDDIEVLEDNTVMVGGDAVVTLEASREIAGMRRVPSEDEGDGELDFRQYRTTNLVTGTPRTLSVIGYTGGTNALDATMQTALSWSVANYNALGLDIDLSLSFATSTAADIVVYKVSGAGGGSAGFPSGGDPYKWVQIHDGTSAYGTNVVEHVITHEIGHTLGFRHTDYFNRSLSCGSGGNEGDAGVGAHHVPGTPTGFDATSVMLSCFTSTEDGELGVNDVIALEELYSDGGGGPTCAGYCGGNAGTCWCDDACTTYGDCCPDKIAECG